MSSLQDLELTNLNWVAGAPVPLPRPLSPSQRRKASTRERPAPPPLLLPSLLSTALPPPSVYTRLTHSYSGSESGQYLVELSSSESFQKNAVSSENVCNAPAARTQQNDAISNDAASEGSRVTESRGESRTAKGRRGKEERRKKKKPDCSYTSLIGLALMSSERKCLPVSEIYAFIEDDFPYFKSAPEGWKNSIRHNLSLNPAFRKVPNTIENNPKKKGHLWEVNPERGFAVEREVERFLRQEGKIANDSYVDRAPLFPTCLHATIPTMPAYPSSSPPPFTTHIIPPHTLTPHTLTTHLHYSHTSPYYSVIPHLYPPPPPPPPPPHPHPPRPSSILRTSMEPLHRYYPASSISSLLDDTQSPSHLALPPDHTPFSSSLADLFDLCIPTHSNTTTENNNIQCIIKNSPLHGIYFQPPPPGAQILGGNVNILEPQGSCEQMECNDDMQLCRCGFSEGGKEEVGRGGGEMCEGVSVEVLASGDSSVPSILQLGGFEDTPAAVDKIIEDLVASQEQLCQRRSQNKAGKKKRSRRKVKLKEMTQTDSVSDSVKEHCKTAQPPIHSMSDTTSGPVIKLDDPDANIGEPAFKLYTTQSECMHNPHCYYSNSTHGAVQINNWASPATNTSSMLSVAPSNSDTALRGLLLQQEHTQPSSSSTLTSSISSSSISYCSNSVTILDGLFSPPPLG